MIASVAKFRLTRPFAAEDYDANERVLVPLLKSQPGYRGYQEVYGGELQSVSITFWSTQQDADTGLAAIRPQLMEHFGSRLDGPPERTFGDLIYADPPK